MASGERRVVADEVACFLLYPRTPILVEDHDAFFPSVKVACVPSPSSRVIDAPNETVQPVAATWTTSGGLFELLVSTSVAAVPGSIPPSSAPTGSTKKTIAKHNSAKAAPDRETAHPSPSSFVTRTTKGIV